MEAGHIQILEYDLKYVGTKSYDVNNPIFDPIRIIIENEIVIAMPWVQ